MQNSGTSMGVDSSLSTGLSCFDGELGMPSGQHLVGWWTSNAPSTCGTGVGSLPPHLPTAFSTFFLFQDTADGQQVISVWGMAVPFPIYGMYHIHW